MRKVYTIILSLAISSSLYAHGNNAENQMNSQEMQKNSNSKVNNHTGDHMHNGKLSNHSNPNGMSNQAMSQMNGMKNGSN